MGVLLAIGLGSSACVSRASCPPGQLDPPSRAPRFVVVRSTYGGGSSALALLDGDGQVIDDDWVDSGTRVSSLVTGLSGDVVVPSTPLGGVAWIDRFSVDVLTLAALDGTITAQIDLRAELEGMEIAFSPNAHDAIRLADGRILVSRHNPSRAPGVSELSLGNDVVVIEDGRITRRIALNADEGSAYARPDVLLPLVNGAHSGTLVTLTRLDDAFEEPAPGAALFIDEDLQPSAPVTFGELQNCLSASLDPDDASRAYVLCAGPTYTPDEAGRRPHAGIVELTLSAEGMLEVTGMATPDATGGVPTNGVIALGGRRVLAVAYGGRMPDVPDRLLAIDVAAGTTREVLRTDGEPFVYGDGVFDAAHDVALVPDAESRAILRIEASTGTLIDSVVLEGCVGLPPREIGPL